MSLTTGGGKPGQGYPAVLEAQAVHENDRHELRTSGTAYCLNTGGGKPGQGQPVVFENHGQDARYRAVGETAPSCAATYGTGGNNQPLVMDDQGGRVMGFSDSGKVGTLRAEAHAHAHAPCVLGAGAADPVPCLQGSMIGRSPANGPQGSGINEGVSFTLNTVDRHAVATETRVRKLMPLECLRLQGFPDWWLSDVPGYSDSAAYKAIGNSMAVPCMRWIGERIAQLHDVQAG